MQKQKEQKAYYYISESNDPYYNISLEYYLYNERRDIDTIYFFWVNRPSIFMGRYQYAQAECDLDYLAEEQIALLRRKSGGGTVFHDLGNLNYTCIKNAERQGESFDLKAFPQPIIRAMGEQGLDLVLSPRGDLRYNGLKVGGSAEAMRRGRMLYHLSLLFDTDLDKLERCLSVKEEDGFTSRVASVRSKVCNIREALGRDDISSVDDFRNLIINSIKSEYDTLEEFVLPQEAEDIMAGFRQNIFEKEEWIYSEVGKKKVKTDA